jgi:hypothetical protein
MIVNLPSVLLGANTTPSCGVMETHDMPGVWGGARGRIVDMVVALCILSMVTFPIGSGLRYKEGAKVSAVSSAALLTRSQCWSL